MTIERVKIIDSLGQEYELPKTFNVRSEPVSRKSELFDIAFSHGARDVSDGCFSPRIVEISGRIWASSDSEFNTAWDALAAWLLKDDVKIKFRGRVINCKKILSIDINHPSTVPYHFGEVSIQYLALDPFWYSYSAILKQFSISTSPYTFSFDVGGNVETYPLIIVENSTLNSSFSLKNITDDNREFSVADSGAVAGTKVYIDCKEGTVERDESTNLISVFSGLFLRLLGGRENQFEYSGAACTLKFQYREAFL